jgi:hypothetical protein
MQEFGIDVRVCDWSTTPHADFVSGYGRSRKHGMGFRSALSYFCFNFWVLWKLLRFSPTLLVVIDAECFISAFAYSFIGFIQRKRLTIIFDLADSLPEKVVNSKGKKFATVFESLCIRFSHFQVYPSENRLPTTPKHSARIVENFFISKEVASSLFDNVKEPGVVFYGGLLLKDRGIEKLISLSNRPDLTIVIVGYGEMQEMVIAAANANPRVQFHGKLPFGLLSEMRSKAQFSWCWYDQSSNGNIKHASGKITESLLVGSIPITNIDPKSLHSVTPEDVSSILYVTAVDFDSILIASLNLVPKNYIFTESSTTESGYLRLLREIYG